MELLQARGTVPMDKELSCSQKKPFFCSHVLGFQGHGARSVSSGRMSPNEQGAITDLEGTWEKLGGRKGSRKTKRKKPPPAELEDRGAGRTPISPSASFKMYSFGKSGGSVSRDANLELESILFKEYRKHMGKNRPLFQVPTWAGGWWGGPDLSLGYLRGQRVETTWPSFPPPPRDMEKLKAITQIGRSSHPSLVAWLPKISGHRKCTRGG